MSDPIEPTSVEPAPLDYGRPTGSTVGQQVGAALSLVVGLVVGAVLVLVAGAFTAMISYEHVAFALIGAGWFAVAVLLGFAIFTLARRSRVAASLPRTVGRFFLLGLLIGGLLAALCDGTCFVGTDKINI